jgi:methyl coenzyme M reductase alpha subunit
VQDEIKKRILIDRRKKFFDEINEKIKQRAGIENSDEFVDFCLQKIYEKNNKQVSYSQ